MKRLPVGTRIFYHGDMANASDFGKIIEIRESKFGANYLIKLDETKKPITVPVVMFCERYSGNGSTRFVTEKAWESWRAEKLQELQSLCK